jgi:hypothetical protein
MTEDGCQEVAVLRCGWDLASVGPSLNLLRPGDATAVRVGGQGGFVVPRNGWWWQGLNWATVHRFDSLVDT